MEEYLYDPSTPEAIILVNIVVLVRALVHYQKSWKVRSSVHEVYWVVFIIETPLVVVGCMPMMEEHHGVAL